MSDMKRIISVLLCTVLMLSLIPSVFATDSELTSLVKFAKGVLEIPEEYTEFESSKGETFGETMYSLMWNVPDSNESIYCEILSTGEIVEYNMSRGRFDSNFASAKFSDEEYLAIAEKWIKKINPTYSEELNFDGEVIINSSSHSVIVSFEREFGEIPVHGNSVTLSLDKETGKVVNLHVLFDISEKVEPQDVAIGEEAAKEKLFELFSPTLKYKRLPGEKKAVLVYEAKSRGDMISACNGEVFTSTYLGTNGPMMKDEATLDSVTGGSNSLTEVEISEIEEMESLLTKQEIANIIKKLAGTVVARYDIQSVNYTKSERKDGEKVYFAVAMLKGDRDTYGEVTLNAKTGELINLYSYDGSLYSKKTKVSEDEMKKTADTFVKNFSPDEYEKSEMAETAYGGRFAFTERVNGVEFAENYVSVYVNEKNGKVMTFSKNWEDGIEFDPAENLISEEDAWSAFVESGGVLKYYIADGIKGYGSRGVEEFRLIYKLSDETAAYVDAKTGKTLDWSLAEKEKEEGYKPQSDLEGHFAEKAVKELARGGVILSKKEKFMPDEAITRREMVYLLAMFECGYYIEPTEENLDNLVRDAKSRGIITDSKTPVTYHAYREEAASVIVNMLGYKKAAELQGIYKTGFVDESAITKEYLGAVAIAKGLGIVNGVSGKFVPRRSVTRGEFAVMLANLYSK